MEIQYRARLQFIRSLEIVCSSHNLGWFVVGDFIRNVLSGTITEDSVFEVAFRESPFGMILRDLEIMGVIHDTDIASMSNVQVTTKSTVIVNVGGEIHAVSFGVRLLHMTLVDNIVSSDSIALTSRGLVIMNRDPLYDYLNKREGIGLMERLVDLSVRTVTTVKPLLNVGEYNASNAMVLSKVAKVLKEDNFVRGVNYTSVQQECPVCMDTQHLITLRCRHSFCGGCLSRHINMEGERHRRCPLCRDPIMYTAN